MIGSALYGEAKLGDQLFKLEGKLLLQKNFGPIVLAYNAGIEAEWEGAEWGQFDEESGEFMESFGISNQRAGRGWRRTNHGFLRWARMIPSSWD